MSAIIATNVGENCAICREEFSPGENRFTHVGGERHDGFHMPCLRTWLTSHPTCPLDRLPIDKYSQMSIVERIREMAKPTFAKVAYGAYGFVLLLMASVVMEAEMSKEGGAPGAGLAMGIGAGVAARVSPATAAVAGTGAVAVIGTVAGEAAGPLGLLIGGAIEAVLGTGMATLVNRVFDSQGVSDIARQNSGISICAGAVATMAAKVMLPSITGFLTLAATAIGTSRILTLIRR